MPKKKNVMVALEENVARNILEAVNITAATIWMNRNGSVSVLGSRLLHRGEMVDGGLQVTHLNTGKFDVIVRVDDHREKEIWHTNLTGRQLEDLFITLADI